MASNPFASYSTNNQQSYPVGTVDDGYNTMNNGAAAEHEPMGTGMAEVDLSRYPEPKESTKKIRGRSDIIEYFFGGPVNRELLIAKAFYLLFFSAFGSLLPLMAIYFKNMGMTPTQAGILIGIRPFVGYLSAPFWADLADRFKKGRIMLLGSLAAWIVFNVPIGFIRPPPTSCLVHNSSGFFIESPKGIFGPSNKITKRSISSSPLDYDEDELTESWLNLNELDSTYKMPPWQQQQVIDMQNDESMDIAIDSGRMMRIRRHTPSSPMKPTHTVGISPYTLEFAVNYKPGVQDNWVSPTFSYTIFQLNDIRKVFFLFLLLIIIGEFFCCPSMTLADTAVLNLLGKENADQYGRQRMFASVGWGLTMFFVCLTLDHSLPVHSASHPCQVHERERNYTVCYVAFTFFMAGTILVATKLPFDYSSDESVAQQQPASTVMTPEQEAAYVPPAPGSWYHPKPAPPPPGAHHDHTTKEIMGDALKNLLGKSKVFAQTTRQIPEWMPVLRHFANVKCASFMFVAWFMGFGIGLIFTFLFWHLQDYGGTSTVFGMASVVNHISEMLAYFLSYPLIRRIGHIKVLSLGLLCNVLRFLYISYISEPWGVIPFELIQGVTHSAVWAAACSYIAHNTPPELRTSAQGVLSFIHNGAGRACGTIFGGIFSTRYGTGAVLRGYGFSCIFVLIGFTIVCFYHRDKGFTSDLTPAEDPHQVAQEMSHLAPHGVPGNPTIVRTASNANLTDHHKSNPTYSTHHGNLDLPVVVEGSSIPVSANNPFLPAGGIQQHGPSSFGYGPEDYPSDPHQQQQQSQQQAGYGHYNSQY